jgi:hypothetical protein
MEVERTNDGDLRPRTWLLRSRPSRVAFGAAVRHGQPQAFHLSLARRPPGLPRRPVPAEWRTRLTRSCRLDGCAAGSLSPLFVTYFEAGAKALFVSSPALAVTRCGGDAPDGAPAAGLSGSSAAGTGGSTGLGGGGSGGRNGAGGSAGAGGIACNAPLVACGSFCLKRVLQNVSDARWRSCKFKHLQGHCGAPKGRFATPSQPGGRPAPREGHERVDEIAPYALAEDETYLDVIVLLACGDGSLCVGGDACAERRWPERSTARWAAGSLVRRGLGKGRPSVETSQLPSQGCLPRAIRSLLFTTWRDVHHGPS